MRLIHLATFTIQQKNKLGRENHRNKDINVDGPQDSLLLKQN
jgi:hypothetical protein